MCNRTHHNRPSPVAFPPAIGCAFATALVTGGSPALAVSDLSADLARTDLILQTPAAYDYADRALSLGANYAGDHQRRYWKPIGIRMGNFTVYPSLGAATIYDDNFHKTASNKKGEFRFELSPEIVARNWTEPRPDDPGKLYGGIQPFQLEIKAGGRVLTHAEYGDQDFVDGYARIRGALHADHAHTLSFGFLTNYEHRETIDLPSPTSAVQSIPIWQNRATIGLTRDAGKLYGTLSATYDDQDYKDVKARDGSTIDQDARDVTSYIGQLRTGFRFSPGFEALMNLRAIRQIDNPAVHLDRDSMGYEGMAGVKFETTPIWKWTMLAGYGYRDYANPAFNDSGASLFEASVQWLATSRLTLTAEVRRAFNESLSAEGSGRLDNGILGRFDYELWNNVVVNGQVGYIYGQSIGSPRVDHLYSAKLGVDWYLSRDWLLNAKYSAEHLTASPANDAITTHRFLVGATYRFGGVR